MKVLKINKEQQNKENLNENKDHQEILQVYQLRTYSNVRVIEFIGKILVDKEFYFFLKKFPKLLISYNKQIK